MSEIKLPLEIEGWLSSFKKKRGHPPRVLHIGNIANNAYNNAKLLNKAGLDCDVISYNYYHIMACPEWEDADFDGEIKDQFFPDWTAVNLKGFQRPTWFAQGPFITCVDYLIARRKKSKRQALTLWKRLNQPPISAEEPPTFSNRVVQFLDNLFEPALASINHDRDRYSAYSLSPLAFHFFRTIAELQITLVFFILGTIMLPAIIIKSPENIKRFKSLKRFKLRAHQLLADFAIRFAERADQMTLADIDGYRYQLPHWERLFEHYDIIQAYSTDPIHPLLANRPYFAFEHGTLREIPMHNTAQGRNTALAYAKALHVFVTNSDCLDVAHRLAHDRVTFLNHPYDEDHGVDMSGWHELRDRLMRDLDADFLFFFPTRHDWVAGTGYADKANDVFIRAFCRLRQNGRRVGMVCCRWGSNVEQSQNLIAQYGFTQHVLWSEPMGIVKFERTAKAAHVVVDQFKLGAFGGVMFKAMSLGVPMCTYLDEAEMAKRFGEVPPVINCRTEDEIVGKIEKLIGNQAGLDELSAAGRSWIKRNHASAETVIAQLSCYMKAV